MSNNEKHPLHKDVGTAVSKWCKDAKIVGVELFLSNDCSEEGSKLKIERRAKKGDFLEMANADIILTKNNMVKVQIEIEEHDTRPVTLLGKIISSVMSEFFTDISKNSVKRQKFDKKLSFIQIVKDKPTSKSRKSGKPDQWEEIEHVLNSSLLPRLSDNEEFGNRVNKYHLIINNGDVLENDKKEQLKKILDQSLKE